jgi:hypothetical protein
MSRVSTFEFNVCKTCENALDALISAAEVFGPAPPAVLRALCLDCAEGALSALAASGGAAN